MVPRSPDPDGRARLENWTEATFVASAGTTPASLNDSSELVGGPFDVVVDDHGVEALPGDLLLGVGPGQPPLDRLRVVGGPALEPAALLLA